MRLVKPTLYEPDAPGAAASPRLLGGRCACGYVFFPKQDFGCERCGRFGADLRPHAVKPAGELLACVTVHIHGADRLNVTGGRRAPFVIGSILLDEGPVVRTLLLGGDESSLAPGVRMTGRLVELGEGEEAQFDLRFVPAGYDGDAPGGKPQADGESADGAEFHSF